MVFLLLPRFLSRESYSRGVFFDINLSIFCLRSLFMVVSWVVSEPFQLMLHEDLYICYTFKTLIIDTFRLLVITWSFIVWVRGSTFFHQNCKLIYFVLANKATGIKLLISNSVGIPATRHDHEVPEGFKARQKMCSSLIQGVKDLCLFNRAHIHHV